MLVQFAMVLSILLGCCALALDIGLLELKKLQMQTAADAAAMEAMFEAERGNADWLAAGRADATITGFTNGSNGVSVSIVYPPVAGSLYAGNQVAFEATVSQQVGSLFLGKTIVVNAQATALIPPCG